ncbi:ATP-binding protein [Geothrix sp.]|jgi:hypothetical protein|uniref:AAA family ATPase n=1 Tax=Geothrix sp. TaxID=1962974 RepID=UPI0025C0DEE0|nr:ATP-binding protein [Geothrix sp.]
MPSAPVSDIKALQDEIANLARLATLSSDEDVRLYLARLVRKYRTSQPALAERLDQSLKATRTRSGGPSLLRQGSTSELTAASGPVPTDGDTRLALIRVFDDRDGLAPPLLAQELLSQIEAIVQEREARDQLLRKGITPTRSAAMIGPPGVGKTLSARWIASRVGKPLWVLDLAAVMSSYLGRTGNNLRSALDYAKANEAVLLLDEFDAIAKRRGDETDVGELKRLVTVMLQEIDLWPDNSLLLAATNHPELVDPALWRRFDTVLKFDVPSQTAIQVAVERFLDRDLKDFASWVPILGLAFRGKSLSDVERAINTLRRGHALRAAPTEELVGTLVGQAHANLPRADRTKMAIQMAKKGTYTYLQISQLTGVARDTIRKHAGPSPRRGRGMK